MAEETEQHNDGTMSGLKKTIIGVATTALMGLGTWGVTQLTGGDEPVPVQAAPVINITNSNNQQQPADGGKTVIIKEKEIVKEVPVKKKKEGDEFKEEEPKW
jgi:hypothetical protein